MAGINTSINLRDGMTSTLRSMNIALNTVINSFQTMENVADSPIDINSLNLAQQELNNVGASINQVEEELQQARQAQEEFNNQTNQTGNSADSLTGKFKQLAVSAGLAFGVNRLINLADTMTSTTARLDLMNDGLQTTAELQAMIAKSANESRTSYQATAEVVSKLGILAGDAFSSNQEMIFFAEQMNKQFKIGGASIQEQTSAMYQLTQAMAAGRLQGDEFRSIMENAPMLAQSIAEYMGKTVGELRTMSSEGKITADVIKNAMLASAEETNAKFSEIPMTFGQVGTLVGNMLLQTFQPVIQLIGQGAQFIYDNWSTLEPIFWGLVTAVTAYVVITKLWNAATWLAVGANRALMVTLLSNPIGWIALAIGVLIGLIFKWTQSVGGLKIAWMIAMNVMQLGWDSFKIGIVKGVNHILNFWDILKLATVAVKTAILNTFSNLKIGFMNILQSMINSAISSINKFIDLLNVLPGVSLDSIQKVTFGTEFQLQEEAKKQARIDEFNKYQKELNQGRLKRDADFRNMAEKAATDYNVRVQAIREAQAQKEAEQGAEGGGMMDSPQINNIADNTSAIADKLDVTNEELAYMRDVAERDYINRFTTAEIKVDMGGITNNVNNETDLDGMVSYLEDKLYETMNAIPEGVSM